MCLELKDGMSNKSVIISYFTVNLDDVSNISTPQEEERGHWESSLFVYLDKFSLNFYRLVFLLEYDLSNPAVAEISSATCVSLFALSGHMEDHTS